MAKQLDLEYVERTTGAGRKYPWNEWIYPNAAYALDSEDFGDTKLGTVSTLIRANAKKRGLAVNVSIKKEEGVVQFVCGPGRPAKTEETEIPKKRTGRK